MKINKPINLIEFYYTGMMIDNSKDLELFIKSNKFYFKLMKNEVKEQFRRYYQFLKNKEEKQSFCDK